MHTTPDRAAGNRCAVFGGIAMKISDFRIKPGEKKAAKKGRRNPIKWTPGKGVRSAHWAAYVKDRSRQNPLLAD